MTEQIDADHLPPGVTEQLGEAAALPGGGERAAGSCRGNRLSGGRRRDAAVATLKVGARWAAAAGEAAMTAAAA